jgi:cobalt transporter subunit CbtA
MIGRVVLAVLLAGIAAGLLMGVIQHVRLTPLILQAETFETAALAHSHAAGTEEHQHDESAWAPADGRERTFFTILTMAVTGAGFAALLAGVSFTSGVPITRNNGLFWGICGFIAVSLAPAAGLPPELPGMPAADLTSRQIWWVLTIVCTVVGLWFLAFRRDLWAFAVGLFAILAPHVFGAPQLTSHDSPIPSALASSFVASSLAANALLWIMIGVFLGITLDRYQKEAAP